MAILYSCREKTLPRSKLGTDGISFVFYIDDAKFPLSSPTWMSSADMQGIFTLSNSPKRFDVIIESRNE